MRQHATIVAAFDTRVRIITGKGGVGKSTVALAMAMAAARQQRRVLLCEVNPAESITRFIGARPLTAEPRLLMDNLWGVSATPHDAMREYALMTLKFQALYNAVFENRLVRYFLRAVPSLGEFVTLGKVWYHEHGERDKWDTIIVDAPATGHLISWLRVPHVFVEMLPAGPLTKSSRDFLEMLLDPTRCKIDVVTLPEEMPVNEAVELDRAIDEHRLGTRGYTIINKVTPALSFDPSTIKPPLGTVLQTRERWRQLGERYLQRLPADDLANAIRLKRRPLPIMGKDAIEGLSRELEAQLL